MLSDQLDYPVMTSVAREYGQHRKLFENKRVFCVIHLLDDYFNFVSLLRANGFLIDTVIGKSYSSRPERFQAFYGRKKIPFDCCKGTANSDPFRTGQQERENHCQSFKVSLLLK